MLRGQSTGHITDFLRMVFGLKTPEFPTTASRVVDASNATAVKVHRNNSMSEGKRHREKWRLRQRTTEYTSEGIFERFPVLLNPNRTRLFQTRERNVRGLIETRQAHGESFQTWRK